MKPTRIACLLVLLLVAGNVYAQGFVNLGFETTTITPVVFPGGTRYTATVPGWTWSPPGNFINGDPNSVGYNEQALDSPAVNLHGRDSPSAPAISGNYSILLQGGSQSVPSGSFSAIWQTGQLPADARSLLYRGGVLQVSFNGQSLTPVAIGNPALSIWGFDISAYAGQTGELQFRKPRLPTNFNEGALLDSIQFSSIPVPEPGALALCGVSVFLLLGSGLLKRPNHARPDRVGIFDARSQ